MSIIPTEKRRILVLLSDTGGGHRASANGLRDALYRAFGDRLEVDILDIWTEHGLWPFNNFVTIYQFASSHPSSWYLVYNAIQSPISRSIFLNAGYTLCSANFGRVFETYKPDLIVSVHPLCQHVPMQVVADKKLEVPFVTVVTDLGACHPTWFHPAVDRVYVPSEALRQAAISEGVEESKVRCLGLPLRKEFWKKQDEADPAATRKKLGLEPTYPTAILVGGGEGVGDMDSIVIGIIEASFASSEEVELVVNSYLGKDAAEALQGTKAPAAGSAAGNRRLQLIVVCGRSDITKRNVIKQVRELQDCGLNIDLEIRSEGRTEAYPSKVRSHTPKASDGTPKTAAGDILTTHLRCVVYGFASDIDVLMGASDLIVTKAGPGTIAEASTRGLPVILSSYLPGQEEGNVNYVLDNEFGTYCTDPKVIGIIVRRWLGDPQYRTKMDNMRAKSFQSSNPTASLDIAVDMAALIGLRK